MRTASSLPFRPETVSPPTTPPESTIPPRALTSRRSHRSIPAATSAAFHSVRRTSSPPPARRFGAPFPTTKGTGTGSTTTSPGSAVPAWPAPYVAGAGILIRQAYEFAGVDDVTPEMINRVMHDTADKIYDPVTGATYDRLNLARAIESIMPADEYGSAASEGVSTGRTRFRHDSRRGRGHSRRRRLVPIHGRKRVEP